MVERCKCSCLIALWSGWGSRQTRSFLFLFYTIISPLAQSVGSSTCSIKSSSTRLLSSFSTFGFRTWWILWGGVTTGVKFSLILMWWFLLRVPIFPKQFENSDRNEASFDTMLQIRSISFRFFHASNPRPDTYFASTTIKETLDSSFICSRVSEHLPIAGISELF